MDKIKIKGGYVFDIDEKNDRKHRMKKLSIQRRKRRKEKYHNV